LGQDSNELPEEEIEDKSSTKKRKRETTESEEESEEEVPLVKRRKSDQAVVTDQTPIELPVIDETSGPTCQLRVCYPSLDVAHKWR